MNFFDLAKIKAIFIEASIVLAAIVLLEQDYLAMNISPIRNQKDYRAALKRIAVLIALHPKAGSLEFDELDVVSTL